MVEEASGKYSLPEIDEKTAEEYRAAYAHLLDMESQIKSFNKTDDYKSLEDFGVPNFRNPFLGEMEVFYEDVKKLETEMATELAEEYPEIKFQSKNSASTAGAALSIGAMGIIGMALSPIPVVGMLTAVYNGITNILGIAENGESKELSMEDLVKRLADIRQALARTDMTPEEKLALLKDLHKTVRISDWLLVSAAANLLNSRIQAIKR